MPDYADLVFTQGDDYSAQVTVNGGQPPDVVNGYTAQAEIRQGPADQYSEVLIEIECDVVSPYINLIIPNSETLQLCGGSYVWDLKVMSASGAVSTILSGNVTVLAAVTAPFVQHLPAAVGVR
jgi:hypothetical protein